jgi:hypothetical protein
VRTYLHLLAQEAFFFEDETWQVLGVHHEPGSACVHVEAIPEDAAYIGYPAFKFVFSFDPALGKCRQDEGLVEGSDEAELVQRLRKLETAKGLTVTCLGCYAFSEDDDKFFLLAPGLMPTTGGEEGIIAEECDPLFYHRPPPGARPPAAAGGGAA